MDEQTLAQQAPEHRHQEHHHHHNKAMAQGQGRDVHVIATDGTDKPVDFTMQSNLIDPNDGELTFNKGKDGLGKDDYYLVTFTLEDKSSKNLSFEPNPMKALWVSMGDAMNSPPCPMSPSYCEDVFAISVDPSGKKMTVRNNDAKYQYFKFSLGFIGDPDNSEYRFDPGGQNQNGGVARN